MDRVALRAPAEVALLLEPLAADPHRVERDEVVQGEVDPAELHYADARDGAREQLGQGRHALNGQRHVAAALEARVGGRALVLRALRQLPHLQRRAARRARRAAADPPARGRGGLRALRGLQRLDERGVLRHRLLLRHLAVRAPGLPLHQRHAARRLRDRAGAGRRLLVQAVHLHLLRDRRRAELLRARGRRLEGVGHGGSAAGALRSAASCQGMLLPALLGRLPAVRALLPAVRALLPVEPFTC